MNPEKITFTIDDIVSNDVNLAVTGEQYVYVYGYVLDGLTNTWKQFKFDQPTVGFSNWIKGYASKRLTIDIGSLGIESGTKDLYALAYACTKINATWACHESKWMIKNFQAEVVGSDLPPEPTVPGSSKCGGLGAVCIISQLNQPLGVVKSILNETDSPLYLAKGKYVESEGDNKNSIYYKQSITLYNSNDAINNNAVVVHAQDDDLAPIEGDYLLIKRDPDLWAYFLTFDEPVIYSPEYAADDFVSTTITILGKVYTISGAEAINGVLNRLTLLSGESVLWLTQNYPITKNVSGIVHQVEVLDVTTDESACQIKVDDVTILVGLDESKVVNGIQISVLDVRAIHAETQDVDVCQLAIGSVELTLTNNQEVKVNDVEIEGTATYLTGTNGSLEGIIVRYEPENQDDDIYLSVGQKFLDPIFGVINYNFLGKNPLTGLFETEMLFTKDISPAPMQNTTEQGIWLTENVLREVNVGGITHSISLEDVSTDAEYCGINVDDKLRWIRVGLDSSFNGVNVKVLEAQTIHAGLQDQDTCRVELKATTEETPYDENYLVEGVPKNINGQILTLVDINEKENLCLIETANGTKKLNDPVLALAVHSQLQDTDVCFLDLRKGLIDFLGTKLNEGDSLLGWTINDVSGSESGCYVNFNNTNYFIEKGSYAVQTGSKLTVTGVFAAHNYLQNTDICAVTQQYTGEANTPILNWHQQNVPFEVTVNNVTHTIEVYDVTQSENACQIMFDNEITMIIDIGQNTIIKGVNVSVLGVKAIHSQLSDKDICAIAFGNEINPVGSSRYKSV